MLIDAQRPEELRVAIVNGNTLESFQVDFAESGLTRGNIYRGMIANVQPSLNAAFIDYGVERHGFLSIQDVVPQAYYHDPVGHPRIEEVLDRGKPIVVQVQKDAVGQKGAALTTNLSLAGRYLVLTPFDDVRGVSRKVEDEDMRKKLKAQATKLELPAGCGVIVRTNALDQTKVALSRDLAALLRLWKRVQSEAVIGGRGGTRLLYTDQDLIVQALRDHLDASIEEVLIDDDEAFERAESYMQAFMPRGKTRLVRYAERLPLFSRYELEAQIDRIHQRAVPLPSGGSIVIDGTEALTAIDVNSGRSTRAATQEETAVHTNVEAANEVARQLRLRDIGGLVVVDFIDMRSSRNQRKVEKVLRDAMKEDKARSSVGRISPNGLLEINRQRIRQALQLRTHRPCPTCGGAGSITSPEAVSLNLLRQVEARAASGLVEAVKIGLHPELADAFQNGRRQELAALEREFDIKIEILASAALHRAEEKVDWTYREKPATPLRRDKPPRPAISVSDLLPPAGGEEEGEDEEPAAAAAPRTERAGRAPRGAGRAERGERGERGRRGERGGHQPDQAPRAAAPAAPAAGALAAEPGAEEKRGKKRRRGGRKRKKSNGAGVDAQGFPIEAPLHGDLPDGDQLPGDEETLAASVELDGGDLDGEPEASAETAEPSAGRPIEGSEQPAGGPRKKRRSRRRRGKRPAGAEGQAAAVPGSAGAPGADDLDDETEPNFNAWTGREGFEPKPLLIKRPTAARFLHEGPRRWAGTPLDDAEPEPLPEPSPTPAPPAASAQPEPVELASSLPESAPSEAPAPVDHAVETPEPPDRTPEPVRAESALEPEPLPTTAPEPVHEPAAEPQPIVEPLPEPEPLIDPAPESEPIEEPPPVPEPAAAPAGGHGEENS